jgi:dynein heavy chain
MDLVFFDEAMKYINKITRILNQPRSNAMLIGLAGFGKQSLTKFSSFMLKIKYETLRIKKNFKVRDFREVLK